MTDYSGEKCIRCDGGVSGSRTDGDYEVLVYGYEEEFYVIHKECHDEISDRNLLDR
jgi:hypothetical protein